MGTVTLRPNGVAADDFGHIGSAADLADDSDSTYVAGDPSIAQIAFDLTTFAFPALSQIRSVTPRARQWQDAAQSPQQFTGFHVTLGYNDGGGGPFTNVIPDTTITTTTGTTSTTGLPSGAWTQAMIDALRFEWQALNANQRLYEAYVDVVYNEAPVANVVAPATTQTALRPIVEWTYTDPEGDAQSNYRVKVFTAAQVAAGGFDPETSTPVWDSGSVASSATSRQVGVDLADNTTHRAYVKVADAGSGTRWGAWDYIEFLVFRNTPPTVNVTAPADPVTDTTQPTVEWTYADADPGDTQERYQVRVIEQSVYSAGGFDEATSDAVWDSGTVYDDAVAAQIGAPLSNATTYRAYVRVGDLTASGTPVTWSAWDYIEFTLDLDAPDAPTLSTPVVE